MLLCFATVAAWAVQDSTSYCAADGRRHTLAYSASVGGASFVDLDGDLGAKLESVTCDVDHTRLTLTFKHRTDTLLWLAKFHDLFTNHFIVGGKQWNCTSKETGASTTYILRRVIASSEAEAFGRDLVVRTAMARYDEVFESAEISYGAAADSACLGRTVDEPICLGANTECDGTATAPLPLYSSRSGALSATCTDCFAALESDVFLSVQIASFRLRSLSFGLRNVSLDARVALAAKAANSTTLAVEKELELVKTTYLLDFKVGAVPFMLFFDIPLRLHADLHLSARADLTLGVDARLRLGDLAIAWDPERHWTHTLPTMSHTLMPTLKASTSLRVDGRLAITPTFTLHFDRMFSYSLVASPSLDAIVSGAAGTPTRRVCLDSSYAMDLVASAQLDINIPVVHFQKEWSYGPKTIGTWSGVPVQQACIGV